ncbi:hypothetical protein Y032_0005g2266 [Ancylostoma ceylanicum]|nr:hypothetical protein Y032_0005g2266 [Ancylostoma ceylanicum]
MNLRGDYPLSSRKERLSTICSALPPDHATMNSYMAIAVVLLVLQAIIAIIFFGRIESLFIKWHWNRRHKSPVESFNFLFLMLRDEGTQ